MSARRIHTVTLVVTNFDEVALMSDERVVQHFMMTRRLSRKALLPAKLRYDGCRVERPNGRVVIHFFMGNDEVAQAAFAPTPDFSQLRP